MRSCEYLNVKGKYRKTKILCLRNIRFFHHKKELRHNDPNLKKATTVSLTFESQKREIQHETITQHKSSDKTLCPVIIWASIVQRILSYPKSSPNTQVNTFLSTDGKLHCITGPQLLKRLWLVAASIGKDILGFSPSEIGLHSARSGAAMTMYLADIPVFTMMLLGRWSSDAFLRYIRKQVQEFSKNVSSNVIQ